MTAESTKNLATETIKKRGNHKKTFRDGNHKKTFPAATETIKKPTTETIKKRFLRRRKPLKHHIRKQHKKEGTLWQFPRATKVSSMDRIRHAASAAALMALSFWAALLGCQECTSKGI